MQNIRPVVAVIQARMSSSRLPGKVLMPIAGRPLIWHLIHRLRQCRMVDKIVIATSTDTRDDVLAHWCKDEGILCVRGSLDNVLDRYRLAAEHTDAKTLLRVTGDSPLIDPGFVDYLVTGLAEKNADFVLLASGSRCAHEGVDVFSRRALDYMTSQVAGDPVAREHVTSWLKLHPETVRTAVLAEYPPLAVEHVRLSVDTADDLAFIRAVYGQLAVAPGEASLAGVLKLVRETPDLKKINAHVRQKTVSQCERHALVCCQGGESAGLGHLRRSLSLARALRDKQGFGVTFAASGAIVPAIREAGFIAYPGVSPLVAAAGRAFDLAVVDVKNDVDATEVAALAKKIAVLAVIDDGSERRLAATHAYYPPMPQARALSWAGSACQPRIGWEWTILGFDPTGITASPCGKRVVVSMGGADPLGLTEVALEALRQARVEADFVIGPAFAAPDGLAMRIEAAGFVAHRHGTDLASLYARAALALVAFGVTAYELAALGVPALYMPISEDHARSASAFADAGTGEMLPLNATPGQIARAVTLLLDDDVRRAEMSMAGPRLVDGSGASNIAADLARAVDQIAGNAPSSVGAR
jgi:spore coat polysaccharide biosynthesis protein SpsF